MSTFSGLSTALSALRYNRVAMDVASGNIANVGTEGYTRRTVQGVAVGAPDQPAMWSRYSGAGDGVQVAGIDRMADMLLDVETSRTLAWAAAWSVSTDADDIAERTALAKAWCSEALSRVAGETVQLHGGIAITWEHDAQLVFKRAHALGQLFGQPGAHRREYARLLGLVAP